MDIPQDDGLDRFTMTLIKDSPPIPLEKIYDQFVKQMTDMDEKEMHNIAKIIVCLIKEIRNQ